METILTDTPWDLETIRALIDCDLCMTTLLHAIGVVGDGPYTLRVSPTDMGYAQSMLSRAFASPNVDLGDVAIQADESMNGWALDNGRRRFYTVGA